jgi:hypothetical protein
MPNRARLLLWCYSGNSPVPLCGYHTSFPIPLSPYLEPSYRMQFKENKSLKELFLCRKNGQNRYKTA